MRLFIIIFLFFKIFSPVNANTIYYLTKIPNLEIYDLTSPNGIKYLKAKLSNNNNFIIEQIGPLKSLQLLRFFKVPLYLYC